MVIRVTLGLRHLTAGTSGVLSPWGVAAVGGMYPLLWAQVLALTAHGGPAA